MLHKYTWYLWFESSCGKDVFDIDHPECIKLVRATPTSDDPTNPFYAATVVEQYLDEDCDNGYEDNDYEIVYVQDEKGRRYKIEATIHIEREWDSEGHMIDLEDLEPSLKEALEELGQTKLELGN